ncbi:MAG: LacI family DNA-binding transcriptional regulator [Mycobacteriales bacterium]
MARSRTRVRITDVAALAGVAPGTASKALSGSGQLRPETRERVRLAAEQLDFHPDGLARGLSSGRSYMVGLITTDSFGRFSIPIMLGAESALNAGQMAVLLCDGREDALREQHYVRTLLARRVDGLIVTGRRTEPREPVPVPSHVPVVYAFTPSADPHDTSVVVDDEGGARLAIEHLLTVGRSRIAVITGPATHRSAVVRAAAAEGAMADAGRPLAAPVQFGEWSERWGRHATRLLLGTDPEIDAIACGSDQIARGVCDRIRESGRRVPHDIAVVGFDNWDIIATACRPPLTTVDMQLELLGKRAAELLLEAIGGSPTPGVASVPCRLVLRESSSDA